MRIVAVQTTGIGGLADGRLVLPEGPVAALAGANGTGKSKLLACLLSPWAQTVPTARAGEAAEVVVELRLAADERHAAQQLSVAAGWGDMSAPEDLLVRTRREPTVGIRRTTEPADTVLQQMLIMQPFLQTQTSLNVIYLPAERRLLPPGQTGIDLNQLSELIAWEKTAESRNSINNYGRLDDQEFEQFAKALCVAGTLPDETEGEQEVAPGGRIQWPEFVETVNTLISPKTLLPLTRQHPEQLRIRTASGSVHGVQDLSSGERQALIIISRILRAGAGHSLVLIDEPDAYLHPHLSQRLTQALERGVGPEGQLVVATHSPAILDNITPAAIVRLRHEESPRLVADEAERVELYRSAGFRASALTQSDLLVITEGESDGVLLTLLLPELTRATVRSAGGRPRVFSEVEQLAPYELPVLGVVDRDILAPPPPAGASSLISVWPSGDIEGVFLSDDSALDVMLNTGLLNDRFRSVAQARALLQQLVDEQRDNAVAEIAQRRLRGASEVLWPTPRGESPIDRLRAAVAEMTTAPAPEVDAALEEAQGDWERHADNRWVIVRGKYVLHSFTSQATEMRSGRALLEAVARARPDLEGLREFRLRVSQALAH